VKTMIASLLWATLLPQSGAPVGGDHQVVVSASSPLTSVKRRDLAKIFLRKVTQWQDGREALPVDQTTQSFVRVSFTRAVLRVEGLSQISAVQSYWQQQLYSGRNSPPPVKADDAEVAAFVATHQGAVGYMRSPESHQGVKVLAVVED
jgi:ABC-type phosphate transport system substrate-binding protein